MAAAWRVIATRGIDGTNMRDLAREAGYANGALSHYFSGKDEILRAAYDHVFTATNDRVARVVGDDTGLVALRRFCHEVMPLTAETLLEARIAVSLWQRGLNDEHMAQTWQAIRHRFDQQEVRIVSGCDATDTVAQADGIRRT